MRVPILVAALFLAVGGSAATSSSALWNEFQEKRAKLTSFHQEFDVVTNYTFANGQKRGSKQYVILDAAGPLWREKTVSGSGHQVRVFDGADVVAFEEGEDEYLKVKRHGKQDDPRPAAYELEDADWSKAKELERPSCGIPGSDHVCVAIDVPLKAHMEARSSGMTKLSEGTARVLMDTANGLLMGLRTVRTVESPHNAYQIDVSYMPRRLGYNTQADAALFKLPSTDMREVKELSRWDAAKIKKRLAGNPAPELSLTDIQGKPVALAAAKGKTVLLDFWTTWCPPCRADAPSLDKLYEKYGDRDLLIVGVSVSEEHEVVEKFLKEHPHRFPVALTTENEMPRAYQIGVFPTYIVIDKDGTVASAVEGEKGFADLRKLLKKAGLEVE